MNQFLAEISLLNNKVWNNVTCHLSIYYSFYTNKIILEKEIFFSELISSVAIGIDKYQVDSSIQIQIHDCFNIQDNCRILLSVIPSQFIITNAVEANQTFVQGRYSFHSYQFIFVESTNISSSLNKIFVQRREYLYSTSMKNAVVIILVFVLVILLAWSRDSLFSIMLASKTMKTFEECDNLIIEDISLQEINNNDNIVKPLLEVCNDFTPIDLFEGIPVNVNDIIEPSTISHMLKHLTYEIEENSIGFPSTKSSSINHSPPETDGNLQEQEWDLTKKGSDEDKSGDRLYSYDVLTVDDAVYPNSSLDTLDPVVNSKTDETFHEKELTIIINDDYCCNEVIIIDSAGKREDSHQLTYAERKMTLDMINRTKVFEPALRKVIEVQEDVSMNEIR